MNYREAHRLFRDGRISDLAGSKEGMRFLLLRSLSRKEHLALLFCAAGKKPSSASAGKMLQEAYSLNFPRSLVSRVINEIDADQRRERGANRDRIVNELYRMKSFDWGGLYQNSLERGIVDNYVKKIWSFEEIERRIDTDLHDSLRGYVLCSWYNHWSSVLIEDIFKDHADVLPAVGRIKNVDFFVNGIPFDLKVTYFPEGYVAEARRRRGLRPELTLLKQSAKSSRIPVNTNLSAGKLLEDLWIKHEESATDGALDLVDELKDFRETLVRLSQRQPGNLMRWLYENQGTRRFDSSNRIFLILVDPENYFNSWKLKRAFQLLESSINAYLDALKSRVGRKVSFDWNGATYTAKADTIFVSKRE